MFTEIFLLFFFHFLSPKIHIGSAIKCGSKCLMCVCVPIKSIFIMQAEKMQTPARLNEQDQVRNDTLHNHSKR